MLVTDKVALREIKDLVDQWNALNAKVKVIWLEIAQEVKGIIGNKASQMISKEENLWNLLIRCAKKVSLIIEIEHLFFKVYFTIDFFDIFRKSTSLNFLLHYI